MPSMYTETIQTEFSETTLLVPGKEHKQWYADSGAYSETPTEVELDHSRQCLDETCHTKKPRLDPHSRSPSTQSINPDNPDRDPNRPNNIPPPLLASNKEIHEPQAPQPIPDSAARLRPRELKKKRSKRPRSLSKKSERRTKPTKVTMPECMTVPTLKKKDGSRVIKKMN
ncbi:hypothetical protein TWF481_002589 [Arthrobotrys musiformis]|uniref:Uncharacterized protein n=1 Tax=Arthrobotrys musiformis TaxID=47236 RepID=A0AAV9VQR8_9PEZI